MNHRNRMILSFLLGCLALYLAATVFAQSTWEGPVFITFFLYSMIYDLVMLYKWRPKFARIVFDIIGNLLTWP